MAAAHPVVTVGDGIIEIPEDLQQDPRYQKGARLTLVPVAIEECKEIPKGKGDWRRLEGILSGEHFDATEWKRQQKEWELAHDERKFGTTRPEW